MKKIYGVIITAGILPFLTGCKDYSASHPIRQKGIIYCSSNQPQSFNPQLTDGGITPDSLSSQLFDRLLQFDENTFLPVPMLAIDWKIRNKGKEYLFTLRDDVHFHSNAYFTPSRLLTAEDVVFSFSRLIDENHFFHQAVKTPYPWFDSFRFSELLKKVEAIDQHQVLFTLNHPDASFLSLLASSYSVIHSKEYAEQLITFNQPELMDSAPIGTGAFKLDDYQRNQFIRLKKHQQSWQKGSTLEQLVYDISYKRKGDLSKLITNECDIISNLTAYQLMSVREDPSFRLIPQPAMNVSYLSLNTQHPILSKPVIRQAINYAIDKKALLDVIYHGAGTVALGLLPPSSWAKDHKATDLYDPQLARSLLAHAGLVQGFDIDLLVSPIPRPYNSAPLKTAKRIQADLAKVNIRVNILINRELSNSLWRDKGFEQDMILDGWIADNADPDNFLRPNLSCDAIATGLNLSNWCDINFERLLDAAIKTRNRAERKAMYARIQRLVREKSPVIPLIHGTYFKVINKTLSGYKVTPFGDKSFAGVIRNQ